MPHRSDNEKIQLNGTTAPPVTTLPAQCPPPPPGIPPPRTGKTNSQTAMKIRPAMPDALPQPREEVRDSLALLKTRLIKEDRDPDDMTFLAHYQQVAPVLQDGPMCGLVALCMTAKLLGKDIKPEEALSAAQDEHFTKQGEMFSVSHMADLAVKLTNCKYELWHGRQVRSHDILGALSDNRPVLIPYDADGNNEPCLKKGHKSHWAVLTGFIWGIKSSEVIESEFLEKDPNIPNLLYIKRPEPDDKQRKKSMKMSSAFVESLKSCSTDEAYVFAKQGKSAHTKLWSLKALLESNDNLVEVGNKIESDIKNYLVPKEGIKRTLCGKVLVLQKRS